MFRTGSTTQRRPLATRRRRPLATAAVVFFGLAAAGTAAASTPEPTPPPTTADAAATTVAVPEATAAAAPASAPAAEVDAPIATAPAPDFEIDPDGSVAIGSVLAATNLDILHQNSAAIDVVLLDNVYETLLQSAPDGSTSPGLASLEVSNDGLTMTLTLQEGVTFADGSPLTSTDVIWTLQELGAPDPDGGEGSTPSGSDTGPTRDGLRAPTYANVESVEAADDTTVVLHLSQPDIELPYNLSQRAGAVVKAESTGLETTSAGTGPFVVSDFQEGTATTLQRNDTYWATAPQIAEVVFAYYPDPNALVNALTDGDIALATAVNTDLLAPFADDPDYTITTSPSNGEFTLGFNNQGEVLSNLLVRQAITQAIDKTQVQALYDGYGTVVGAPVPPFEPWFEDLTGVLPFDQDAAKAKLAEAGYPDGVELRLTYPNHYPSNIADYLVSALGDVGITVELQTIEFATWVDQVYLGKDFDLTVVAHVEARDIFNYANPDYYWGYDNPEVQQLLADSRTTTDPAESTELRRKAAAIIADEAPTDVIALLDSIVVAGPGIAGYPTFDVNARFPVANLVVEA